MQKVLKHILGAAEPVSCPPPHPQFPSVVLSFPIPEKAWPQAQTPIQAGGKGKCTVLDPFSEKLRVLGIPGEYLPVHHWSEHGPNNEELEKSGPKQKAGGG